MRGLDPSPRARRRFSRLFLPPGRGGSRFAATVTCRRSGITMAVTALRRIHGYLWFATGGRALRLMVRILESDRKHGIAQRTVNQC